MIWTRGRCKAKERIGGAVFGKDTALQLTVRVVISVHFLQQDVKEMSEIERRNLAVCMCGTHTHTASDSMLEMMT